MDPDFSGYATRAGLKCTDGRTITPEAFQHMDGKKIPLVWQHMHNAPDNVLGHGVLEHRKDGMYVYGYFNDTPAAQHSKTLVDHEDIENLSIYANQLVEKNKVVQHGNLIEFSLVLSGANPGAKIDYVRVQHGSGPDAEISTLEDEAIIFGGQLDHADGKKKTYQDVYETLDDDQKTLVEFMVAQALNTSAQHSSDTDTGETEDQEEDTTETETDGSKVLTHSEETNMGTRNVFDQNKDTTATGDSKAVQVGGTLNHSQIQTIFEDAKKMGSFKEAFLAHAEDYGITNIEVLFPDAKAIDARPEWITRRMEWVEGVLNGTQKLPWSRIKSLSADLTHEEARAKGYIKGNLKKEQFFEIATRETTPKTVYKKQKLDRDDIVDITDFDVVAWLWVEMRFMLREEVARAILISDGREVDDDDKINENNIRPIAFDVDFYTDKVLVDANVQAESLIEAVLRARYQYKGTAPSAYMTNAVKMDLLLAKDRMGRRFARTDAELAAELQVKEIVEVPPMEGVQIDGGEVLMIIVNMADYAVGSTRGGEITTFDDFDIDYNQYKYLIETRLSGALTKHKRAQVFVRGAGTQATPTVPTFNSGTGVITIPTVTGVTYKNQDTNTNLTAGAQTALDPGDSMAVKAVPNAGYYFPHNYDADWVFTRPVA